VDCASGAEGTEIESKAVTFMELKDSPVTLVALEINLEKLTFGIQVRLISNGVIQFNAFKTILLICISENSSGFM